ncbi:IS21 family transposase [Bacillus sp. DJP31]|uniref:IS21 family transposase n=1 Tax=Bacillus sp. DJP31 TaxID=3409789 RepID=UPI003BB81604
MNYIEIHRLHKEGFSKSSISRKLNISRNRVIDYLSMSLEEFQEFASSLKTREKKLDHYHNDVLGWLREYPDLTSAQIFDWLEEKLHFKDVAENTVRNYVNHMRDVYHIPKISVQRTYSSVPELPMGQQVQVDFGQTVAKDIKGCNKRLYFIAFVLSHSRYKYVEWLDRPFRTSDVIRMHENAFHYFEGMPLEMVYDQDALLAVSENAGDLIMTAEFTKYHQTRRFNIYLCRKSDPETKGKIEQVVQFVKNNFSKNRVYDNIADWNLSCNAWLKRTGNHKVHHNTKKRPSEVHALEKQHLKKVSGTYIFENVLLSSITRMIQKDNVIRFGGNRYSVPIGTYRNEAPNIAYLQEDAGHLFIRLKQTGSILAQHRISEGRGLLVSDPSHRERNTSKREALIQEIEDVFIDKENIQWLVEQLKEKYPRHLMDQL